MADEATGFVAFMLLVIIAVSSIILPGCEYHRIAGGDTGEEVSLDK